MGGRYVQLAFVLFFVAIFVPSIFGDTNTDGWAKWVSDFQTLIAGTAAVVAASYTVAQMKVSDALQERRHRELLRSGLRQEQAAAERIKSYLNKSFMFVEIYVHQHLNSRPNIRVEWTHPQRKAFYEAVYAAFSIEAILQNNVVKEASSILPSKLYVQMGLIQSHLNRLKGFFPDDVPDIDPYDKSIMNPTGYKREVDFVLAEIARCVTDLLTAAEEWETSLRKTYEG